MALNTLLLVGVATLLVALAYAYVGLRLLDRKALSEPAGRAMGFFSLWWLATATNQAVGGTLYLAASQGWTSLDVQLTYVILQRILLAVSLVGLMYYLLYLFKGDGHLVLLSGAYLAYAAFQIHSVMLGEPRGVDVGRWRTDLEYAVRVPRAFQLVNLVFLVLVPLGGSLALWRLFPQVETRGQRFRVAAVSIGFTLWWLVAVIAGQAMLHDNALVQGANRLLGLAVAVLILAAYEPPAWVRRRFGVEPYRRPAA